VTEEGIHTAIVYGMVTSSEAEEAIMGSVRTVKITLDPDEFIKRIFGRDSSGHYYGGGKSSAGGFGIPVWFRSGGEDEEHRERKWQVFNEEIKQKLFAGMGVESVANHRPRGLDNSVVVH
jgi:nanoRNase/pAp phosphatase (c-di-AMP/oligoRNAs hydrolase)